MSSISLPNQTFHRSAVCSEERIVLFPAERGELRGGFLFPLCGHISSDFLAASGWTSSSHDPIRSVHLSLNEVDLGEARRDLPCLLSPSASTAVDGAPTGIFVATIARTDPRLERVPFHRPVKICARCTFQSGRQLDLIAPDLIWEAERFSEVSVRAEGTIEKIALIDGRLAIEGWIASRGIDPPQLLLSGTHGTVLLAERPEERNFFAWIPRVDIDLQYLSLSGRRPFGFAASVNPLLLGRYPGYVRLLAQSTRGALSPVGSHSSWTMMTELMNREGMRNTNSRGVAHSVITAAGRLGLRWDWNSPKVTPPPHRGAVHREPSTFLFATPNLRATEGAPRMLADVVEHVHSCGARTAVVSAVDGELRPRLESAGIEVVLLPGLGLASQLRWEDYQQSVAPLYDLCARLQPDAIYANTVDAFWAVDASFHLELPALWAVHESVDPLDLFPQLSPQGRMQVWHRLRYAKCAIFACQATAELFRPFVTRSAIIPNGVDVPRIDTERERFSRAAVRHQLGLGEADPVIAIVGTTTPRKGQDTFLHAAKELLRRSRRRGYRFLVVGARQGRFLEDLAELIRQLDLQDAVALIPETAEVAPFFIASDVLVIASREESAPLVSLEAFAYERPLVSTRVFGLAEQVRPEVNALTFSPGSPGELADQIERLLDDRSLRDRLTRTARRDVEERFALDRAVAAHHQLLTTSLR